MWNSSDDGRPRRPMTEPEIIPPGRPEPQRRGPEQVWVRQRVFMAPPGPLGVLLGLLAAAVLAGVGLVVFAGFFLLALPVMGAVAIAVIAAALLRGPRRL